MSLTRRLLAATAALAAALALLGAASAEQSKYGGVLVVALANGAAGAVTPDFLGGPASVSPTTPVYDAICQGLYTTDKKLDIVPQLAISMPTISPDRLTYSVQLRQGVVFNDGTPFNAQAVVATYEHDINSPSLLGTSNPLQVFTVTATGPYTVVFHLQSRYSPFLQTLQTYILSPTQLQKLGSNFGSDPICVGPFMYDSQVPGTSVTVIKSPYFYEKYLVYLDKIVFQDQSNTAVAAADLEAGDIQAVNNLNTGDVPGVQADKSLTLLQSPVNSSTTLAVNLGSNTSGNPLAQSPQLLQAFEEAINRTALAKVLAPVADPGCTFIGPLSPYYDPSLKCTPYNPAQARKLDAESGIPNPTVHLDTTNLTRQLVIAQVIQADEQAVGINVVLDVKDFATVTSDANAGNYEVADSFAYDVTSDPGLILLRYDKASDNLSHFSTPQLSLILANYVKSTSVQSRQKLLDVAQQILMNARPFIVLYHSIRALAYSNCLSGVQAVNGSFYRLPYVQYTC